MWLGWHPDLPAGVHGWMTARRSGGGTGRELLVNTIVSADERSKSGETKLYKVPGGRYYLDVIAPDDWSVPFTPL